MPLTFSEQASILKAVNDAVVQVTESEIKVDPPKIFTSDAEGFITLPNVDKYLESVGNAREWLPNRFNYPSAHAETHYITEEARLSARQNLANRNWLIWGQRMLDCKPIQWRRVPLTGPDAPWDTPSRLELFYGDGFVPNAWSWGWDDKDINPEKILELVRAFHKRGP